MSITLTEDVIVEANDALRKMLHETEGTCKGLFIAEGVPDPRWLLQLTLGLGANYLELRRRMEVVASVLDELCKALPDETAEIIATNIRQRTEEIRHVYEERQKQATKQPLQQSRIVVPSGISVNQNGLMKGK